MPSRERRFVFVRANRLSFPLSLGLSIRVLLLEALSSTIGRLGTLLPTSICLLSLSSSVARSTRLLSILYYLYSSSPSLTMRSSSASRVAA